MIDCVFINNYGATGGGLSASGNPFISGCVFMENSSNLQKGYGGGMNLMSITPVNINNCIFYNNQGNVGAGACTGKQSEVSFFNCTFAFNSANSGAGIGYYYSKTITIKNSILAFSSSGEAVAGHGSPSVDIQYCDVFGNTGGDWVGPIAGQNGINGNINADPVFADNPARDLHLCFTSPCRNAGDNTAVVSPKDFEGDPRLASGFVDMGADEFHTHMYYTGNAVPGGGIELKFIDIPSPSLVLLWLGSGVLSTPLSLPPHGDWYLQFPILLQAALGSIPGPDGVLALPFTLPLSLPTPLDLPLQAGIGIKLTNLCVMEIR